MRREPYSVGSYLHIIKRGTRGTDIVRDDADRWRFLLMLRHFNDEFQSENWVRDLIDEQLVQTLDRPTMWPEQKKLVNILCFCLQDNHFHLLIKEIREKGTSTFMQRIGTGMAACFNAKYSEKGALFQGAYKSRTIGNDTYLRYVSAYIQVKNAFEIFPGGLNKASKNFEKAFKWASIYPYTSLGSYVGKSNSPILEKEILGDIFSPDEYKGFARDFIEGRTGLEDVYSSGINIE